MYPLFDGLEGAEIDSCLSTSREVTIRAGQRIIEEGRPVDNFYILKSGTLHVCKLIDSREEIISVIEPGDFFGESTLSPPGASLDASATVIGLVDSIALSIAKDSILGLLESFPRLTWNIANALSRRLHASNETLKRQIESYHQITHKEISRLNSLIEATQTVNSSLELGRVLQLILDEAIRITEAERGTIYLVDEEAREIWSRILVGGELNEIRQPIGKGISGFVAETGESVSINDAYSDSRFNPFLFRKFMTSSRASFRPMYCPRIASISETFASRWVGEK